MTADPSRPEALYNMALAYTFGQMKNEAISTWKSFLSKFKDTYYAGEAQKKLDVLEGKKAPRVGQKAPLHQAATDLRHGKGTKLKPPLQVVKFRWQVFLLG
jgi:hypothetical protein